MERINSNDNPTLKLARKLLRSSRERKRSGKILLDGAHLVRDYGTRFGLSGAIVLVSEAAVDSSEITTLVRSAPTEAKVVEVGSSAFAAISPVETPSGVVALCDRPTIDAHATDTPFQLLLDGIQDPGNLGAILRTAAAMGVNAVFLSETCADPWSPKALRGGMGAQFAVPVALNVDAIETANRFLGKTVSTSPHSGQTLMDTELSGPLLAIFGGEGGGVDSNLAASADVSVKITLQNNIESLNVGAAVAMLCYERLRQASR